MDLIRRVATKPFVVMPVIAVLVLAGWWFFRPDEGGGSTQGASEQVVEASLGSMTQSISAQGTLEYAESEDLSFSAKGTVTSVAVEAGQAVTAGQVLATMDSPELEAAVASAETTVAEAQARLDDDRSAGASSAQIAADESSLATANDQLTDAQDALAGAQLVAPFDGTVASVDLAAGEELGSGGSSGTSLSGSGTGSGQSSSSLGSGGGGALPGGSTTDTSSSTAQIQVVSAGRFVVEVGFDDIDIANVTLGQDATVSLSTSSGSGFPGGGFPGGGFPGGGFAAGGQPGATGGSDAQDQGAASTVADVASASGTVTEVSSVADASSGVATYPVSVEVTDDSGDYNAGATVSVELSYGDPTEVVQVPSFAVTTADDGTSTVTVRGSGGDETRTVITGETSGTMVAITSGLEAGEQVVITLGGGPGGGGSGGGGFPGGADGGGGFPGGAGGFPGGAQGGQ